MSDLRGRRGDSRPPRTAPGGVLQRAGQLLTRCGRSSPRGLGSPGGANATSSAGAQLGGISSPGQRRATPGDIPSGKDTVLRVCCTFPPFLGPRGPISTSGLVLRVFSARGKNGYKLQSRDVAVRLRFFPFPLLFRREVHTAGHLRLRVRFPGVKYVHVVVQPSPPSISRTFHPPPPVPGDLVTALLPPGPVQWAPL